MAAKKLAAFCASPGLNQAIQIWPKTPSLSRSVTQRRRVMIAIHSVIFLLDCGRVGMEARDMNMIGLGTDQIIGICPII